MPSKSPAETVADRLARLTPTQQEMVGVVIERLLRPVTVDSNGATNPFTTEFVRVLGEALQLHHALSDRHLSKEHFESVLVRSAGMHGIVARHGPAGYAGYDVEVEGEKWSLKTQADKGMKRSIIHISKFMELGQGAWTDEASLHGLRDRFLKHLNGYSRIFTLRYYRTPPNRELPASRHEYELIELPKPLLLEATDGEIEMRHNSRQSPKPGYCYVRDAGGAVKYSLYFDGGTERKLQVKSLDKSLCVTVATWAFGA
jgi:Type II site-specific deoxyribonuclease